MIYWFLIGSICGAGSCWLALVCAYWKKAKAAVEREERLRALADRYRDSCVTGRSRS